jgi:deferrochelatase/peroxidase EfeB
LVYFHFNLQDQVVIFPGDNGNDETHTGGSYMYVGKFVHDLEKFEKMEKDEKNQIIGRDYHTIQKHKGYDTRPENPLLTNSEDESHVNRGYSAMYRHAMPFISETEQGLYFVAVSRSLDEMDIVNICFNLDSR